MRPRNRQKTEKDIERDISRVEKEIQIIENNFRQKRHQLRQARSRLSQAETPSPLSNVYNSDPLNLNTPADAGRDLSQPPPPSRSAVDAEVQTEPIRFCGHG